MTLALWCVLISALMPYVWGSIAKVGGPKYDNNAPRDFLARLDGWRKRANWAQNNSFEAFPFFAAAVIIAHMVLGQNETVDSCALGFVACRIVYGFFYITDKATLRSLIWTAGIGLTIAIFIISGR